MKRTVLISLFLSALLAIAVLIGSSFGPSVSIDQGAIIQAGPLSVWSVYDGKLESRQVVTIMSHFNGSATIVELAPEGAHVEEGALLVRFDCSSLERELLKLERDYALARSELTTLENAEIPLELQDLEIQLLEARATYAAEQQYLTDSIALQEEGLVSEQEIRRQELKLEPLRLKLESLETRMRLLREYLHPAALEKAGATLASAEQQLTLEREQLNNCTVRAPSAGVVTYRPLHISGEFRTVRVGDSIFKNQPFMELQDMTDLVVHLDVPESELSRVRVGNDVRIVPLAYPDMNLQGNVESVGSMARSLSTRPGWQRYFHVVAGLARADEHLRSNMSVHTHVLSYHSPDAVLVPRQAIRWERGNALCTVRKGRRRATRELRLGMANETHYEVLEGLQPGERVLPE